MPNYQTHIHIGKYIGLFAGLVSGILSLLITFDPIWGVLGAVIGYYSTVIGSIAPDVDLSRPNETLNSASIPYRKLISALNFGIVIVLVFGLARFNQGSIGILSALGSVFAVGVAVVAIRLVPDILHEVMPIHRTKTHQPTFWLIMSSISAIAIHRLLEIGGLPSILATLMPVIIWFSMFIGAFTHISSDYVSTLAKRHDLDSRANTPVWVPTRLPLIMDLIPMLKIVIDRRAPSSVRFLVVLTVGYALSPVDLISDVIPFLGWTDDFMVYLYLRRTVYNTYEENVGALEYIKKQVLDVRRGILWALEIYATLLILGLIAIFYIIIYL